MSTQISNTTLLARHFLSRGYIIEYLNDFKSFLEFSIKSLIDFEKVISVKTTNPLTLKEVNSDYKLWKTKVIPNFVRTISEIDKTILEPDADKAFSLSNKFRSLPKDMDGIGHSHLSYLPDTYLENFKNLRKIAGKKSDYIYFSYLDDWENEEFSEISDSEDIAINDLLLYLNPGEVLA